VSDPRDHPAHDPGDDLVEPRYGDRTLGDVLPAVAAGLGLEPDVLGEAPAGLALPPSTAYVVLLIDGLGARLLEQHAHLAPYLSSLPDATGTGPGATAGVPSTTATSLTSLGTALTPGTHGVVGFTSRIPHTKRLLEALRWDDAVDPREWQPHPTAFERLAEAGVTTTTVNQRAFRRSGLTVAGHRGAEWVGADKTGERIAAVATAAARTPSVTYCYDGDLDWVGHRHGVDSDAWRAQLVACDADAQRLRAALPPRATLVVVADHGMIDAPQASRVDVAEVPALREGVDLLAGEARFRHLYVRHGALDDVVAAWTAHLGDGALVLPQEDAVARGWFGPPGTSLDTDVSPRVGDVVVACRGDVAVFDSDRFAYETRLVGLHGSLTATEMLIPVRVD
jgi:hypothetical protein